MDEDRQRGPFNSFHGRSRKHSTTGEDLYRVLGIEKSADADAIKRAYRKLALKYHPDKNAGDPAAAETFKQVNYANAVLSNPTKRQIYDAYGSVGLKAAETLGEDQVGAYLLLKSGWFKAFVVCCGIVTGFYCCCCCCCCCNCCCGKFKPPHMDDETFYADLNETDNVVSSQPKPDSSPLATAMDNANTSATAAEAVVCTPPLSASTQSNGSSSCNPVETVFSSPSVNECSPLKQQPTVVTIQSPEYNAVLVDYGSAHDTEPLAPKEP